MKIPYRGPDYGHSVSDKTPIIVNDLEDELTTTDLWQAFFLLFGVVAFLVFAQLSEDVPPPCTASPTAACEHLLPLR